MSGGVSPDDARRLLADRLERVGALLAERGADALVLRRAENLAWVTGGGDVRVSREGDPVAEAIVTPGRLVIVTNRIEAARFEAEVAPPGAEIESVPWFEPGARAAATARLTAGLKVVSDAEVDLATLRIPLGEIERGRFARLGALASERLTDAASTLEPGMRESAVAARVHASLREAGLELPVVLVAGAERFGRFRHPVVTDAPFGAFGLLVVCAVRHGLVASLSRMVAFGEVPDEVQERLEAVQRIEAAMLTATVPDVPTNVVLEAARAAYAREGHADAWHDHHQGGPAGYTPREWLATPSETRPLRLGTPVAWNPSLPFAKCEDSFLITEAGLQNCTWDERWPSVEVDGRPRAAIRFL
jgi:Xaa-Pro aminopeptidase